MWYRIGLPVDAWTSCRVPSAATVGSRADRIVIIISPACSDARSE